MQSQTHRAELFAPFDWYRSMRATQPVSYDEKANVWHVFGYEDVARALTDHDTFSSDRGALTGEAAVDDPRLSTMFTMDPPRHRQMRNLVSVAFTPATVHRVLPRIRSIADELLDRVVAKGEMDVVADLAYPLPVTVIAELLGIPTERQDDFRRWADAAIAAIGGREADADISGPGGDEPFKGPDPQSEIGKALEEMYAYLGQIVEERRREPRNDLVSNLVGAELDGTRLGLNELIGFCGLLLSAGHNTTAQLISNAVLCLDENPGVLARLRQDETLLPGAIEEVLRYLAPAQAMVRFARKDAVLGGQHIAAGASVFPWMGSANRDDAEFLEPDRFDIERQPNRHLGFGWGIHFCLGAALARAEGRIALTAMMERLQGGWSVADEPLERIPWFFMFGVRRLPMAWGA
jgi:cytochrome P450